MKGLLKILVVLALLAGGVFLWQKMHARDSAPALVTVARTDVIETVYATGEVEPVTWAQVSPQVTVRLDEIPVHEGDRVEKGQLLAKADDSVEVSRLNEYQSHLQQLENDLARNRKLAAKGFATKEALDAVGSDYKETLARIESQKLLIARMSVTAPTAGVVLRRDAEPGEVKRPEQVIFWIGQPFPLRVKAEVDEEDILRVKQNQQVLIKTDALEDRALDGTVNDVTPKGDPVNKNFRVYIALPGDTPLRVGMTVEVNIVAGKRAGVLAVPASSVSGGHVMLWRDNKAENAPVETGMSDGKMTEILKGLNEGDKVLADYAGAGR